MGRSPCCSKIGLNRGAWTASEDKILSDYIKLHGEGKWRHLPIKAGLKRCGKSCRLRWLNYLRPDIKRGNISPDEEDLIIRLHKLLGNRWSLIAGRLPGRTDNEIKNYWNTTLAKKVHQHRNDHDSVSTQSYDKYEKLKMKKKRTRNNESRSTYSNDLNVVRTKAVRCSKAIFSPHPLKTEPIKSDIVEVKNPTSPKHKESSLPFRHEDDDNSSNFMLDAYTVEAGSFSSLFNLDFTYPFNLHDQIVKEDMHDQIVKEDISSTSSAVTSMDATQAFTKQMMDYFSSIPEIGGEWLSSL